MVQPAWKIENPGRKHPPGATKTDGDLLEEAFREICPRTRRVGDEIRVPTTGPTAGRTHGCRCLAEIELGLPRLKSARPPAKVGTEPFGWSVTITRKDPVQVSVRHPSDEFGWGYWTNVTEATPYERRQGKPFFMTLAHEVCGHVGTFVRTGGRHAGGRSDNPRGHDPAIERENLIAAEHGVAKHRQRGFTHEKGDRPGTRHGGESFLRARVRAFAHASDRLGGTNADEVAESAKKTSDRFPIFLELRGAAYRNEGGRGLADDRADRMRRKLEAKGISRRFTPLRGPGPTNRFRLLPGAVEPGASAPLTSDPGRRVDVFLFHDRRSSFRLLPADVFFDFDEEVGRGVSTDRLEEVADHLTRHRGVTVELVGHTDVSGPASYNQRLGLKRARHVAAELKRRGVRAGQIRAVQSRGERDARARSRATRWQDRRVEIRP